MGSKVSLDKCYTLACGKKLRATLKRQGRAGQEGKIRQVWHARDLGAHINVGQRSVNVTGTDRLQRAASV
eukprot:12646260-Alexandrium_andersonii.AAC.1